MLPIQFASLQSTWRTNPDPILAAIYSSGKRSSCIGRACLPGRIAIAFQKMISIKKTQSAYGARSILRLLCLAVLCPFVVCPHAQGDTQYYSHTLFDNSLEPDAYYYSSGKASSPSTLSLIHGKLPVSRDLFYTPPNALRLKWRSVPDGGWEAGIRAINFRNREINFQGDTFYFWCFSTEGISARALPLIQISDNPPRQFFDCASTGKVRFRFGGGKMGSSTDSPGGIQDWIYSRIAAPPHEQDRLYPKRERFCGTHADLG